MKTQIKSTSSDNIVAGNGLKNHQLRDIIIDCICRKFNTKPEFFLHRSRKHGIIYRQIIQYLLKYHTGYSSTEIGIITSLEGVSSFDHATILHNRKQIQNDIDTSAKEEFPNTPFRRRMKRIIAELNEMILSDIANFDAKKQESQLQRFYGSVKKLISDCEDNLLYLGVKLENQNNFIDNKNICKKLLNTLENETN